MIGAGAGTAQRAVFALAALAVLPAIGIAAPARADDFYVAPDGDDDNPGTMQQPFASVARGEMAASPGDTVFIRGGEYGFSGTVATVGVAFTKSGTSGQPIRYFAYPGETPIFDLFELRPQARVTGLDVRCNWIHIRGLEVRGVRQLVVGDSWSVRIRGDNNVIEQLNVHDGEAPGIFITSGASNLILNCDSHHNYDPLEDGGNADGFGCHSTGGDNVMRGCRAYENSDDGFDFINAPGTCIVEESWAFRNGYIPETNTTGANGAGFKAGGFGNPPNVPATGAPRHVVRKSLAFRNRSIGFYANYHPGGLDFLNNTAFDNPANFDMRTAGGTSSHTLRNNVAAEPGRDIVSFNGGTDDFNSWTLSVEVSSADFMGTDVAQALLPREADGSLPRVDFLRLAEGSDLIDRGEDVGLPFTGSAPDLGAYEWGEEPPGEPPDGGLAGAGASAGAGAGAGAGGATGAGASGAQAGASGAQAGAGAQAGGSGGTAGIAPPSGGTNASETPTGAAGAHVPAAMGTGGDEQSDGCGCRVGRPRPAARAWLLLLLAAPWLAVRRRSLRARSSLRGNGPAGSAVLDGRVLEDPSQPNARRSSRRLLPISSFSSLRTSLPIGLDARQPGVMSSVSAAASACTSLAQPRGRSIDACAVRPCGYCDVERLTVKILLAIDGSAPSETAVREVASRPWPEPHVTRVLYVEPIPMLAVGAYPMPAATMGTTTWPSAVVDAEREMAERAAAKATQLAEALSAAGMPTEFKRRRGDARSEILDEAKEWHADLIVMGSHGYTGFKRWLLGSVAQAVVSHAPCSVEVVRHPAQPR